MKRRQNNEAQLEKELGRFFRKLKKSVLKELNEYWSDYQLLQGQVNLMLSPIHEAHKEYYEIIRKYKLREYELGKAEAKRLTKRANKDRVALKAVTTLGIQGFVDKDKNNLFGTIPKAEQDLLNRTFRASENTLNRVDNQLNQIISDGYREGKGINKVANDITQRFDQLADWEARRIARTEINTSHNQATRDQYKEDGVEYTQWIAANDDRTRDSHADVDGEIIPIDGKYSNGLAFPGDTSGPFEEWINCRCSNAPFVIPYGFMAPSFSPFRESDLVPINTESLGEPSPEQLEQNLTQEQRSQYEQYTRAVNEAQSILDSKFSLPRERLQARTQLEYNLSKLNQLKLVANGELARGYQQVIGTATVSTNQQETQGLPKVYDAEFFIKAQDVTSPEYLILNKYKPSAKLKTRGKNRTAEGLQLVKELDELYQKSLKEPLPPNERQKLDSLIKTFEEENMGVYLEIQGETPVVSREVERAITEHIINGERYLEYAGFQAENKNAVELKHNEGNITGAQKKSGKYYTYHGDGYMNKYLRECRYSDEHLKKMDDYYQQAVKDCVKDIENLRKAIENSAGLSENTLLFRGVDKNLGKHWYETLKKGDVLKWEGFNSASFKLKVGEEFAHENISEDYGVVFRIFAKEGQKGIPMSSFSHYAEESEFLLGDGLEVRVLNVHNYNDVYSGFESSQTTKVVDVEIIME